MTRGKYIVLEGPEGVGKTTQVQELVRRLQAAGLPVKQLREPDSQSDLTARAIRRITQDSRYPMNTKTEVLLYNAARSQSLQIIRQCIENGVNCVVDRNYLTNLAVQYYGRGDVPDYDTINNIINFAVGGIEPDLCIVFDAPVDVLKARLEVRHGGDRFDDLDYAFLERVRAGYLWEARQRNLPVIFATSSPESIADNVWKLVTSELSVRSKVSPETTAPPVLVAEVLKQKPSLQVTPELSNEPYLSKSANGAYAISDNGREYLNSVLTDPDGDVYAFNNKLDPVTVAAAMARLSRRGDDMRIIILDEFANKADKDSQLLKRIITAYGDDSVQQLGGLHLVVENASNLLTKKLEWGRLAAYLEQSTRYIYFDQKDKAGHYRYYVPNLKNSVRAKYRQSMDEIFDLYSKVVRELTEYIQQNSHVPKNEQDGSWRAATRAEACDAARAMLPVATKSTVGIFASGQAVESLIMHLLSDDLKEANKVGQKLLTEARKVIPMYLERADKPDRGGATVAYRANTYRQVERLALEKLPRQNADLSDDVTLTDYWPKNELSLVADMLYEHSDLSLNAIQDEVNKWPYSDKLAVFKAYMGERLNRRHRPGRALEKAHYSWDILCDYGIFRDLQRHRMVDDLTWQQLTPRFGYDIPKLVEKADLSDLFEQCFDKSLALYSLLVDAGYTLEAQYACLLGHKMRWQITYNAREAFHLHELRTSPQGHPGYRKLVLKMHEQLKAVHPNMAEAMKFVNQGEDPELTRLAAERYSQFKRQRLQKSSKE